MEQLNVFQDKVSSSFRVHIWPNPAWCMRVYTEGRGRAHWSKVPEYRHWRGCGLYVFEKKKELAEKRKVLFCRCNWPPVTLMIAAYERALSVSNISSKQLQLCLGWTLCQLTEPQIWPLDWAHWSLYGGKLSSLMASTEGSGWTNLSRAPENKF